LNGAVISSHKHFSTLILFLVIHNPQVHLFSSTPFHLRPLPTSFFLIYFSISI
jgi:hypothetical protein